MTAYFFDPTELDCQLAPIHEWRNKTYYILSAINTRHINDTNEDTPMSMSALLQKTSMAHGPN